VFPKTLCCGEKRHAIGERQNTFVCAFYPQSPRISAYEIHEWIYDALCLREFEVVMIQTEGPKRHVYIKLSYPSRMQDILTSTTGHAEYQHTNGVISKVRIEAVGFGLRKVGIANLPSEFADSYIRISLGKFGEIRDIQNDSCSNAYRYSVPIGIRIATLNLVQHIPSHIIVAGHITLISYERQPTTCYGCNEMGHLYQVCSHRRRPGAVDARMTRKSWAHVTAMGPKEPQDKTEGRG